MSSQVTSRENNIVLLNLNNSSFKRKTIITNALEMGNPALKKNVPVGHSGSITALELMKLCETAEG
jgi:hypothetical protein